MIIMMIVSQRSIVLELRAARLAGANNPVVWLLLPLPPPPPLLACASVVQVSRRLPGRRALSPGHEH